MNYLITKTYLNGDSNPWTFGEEITIYQLKTPNFFVVDYHVSQPKKGALIKNSVLYAHCPKLKMNEEKKVPILLPKDTSTLSDHKTDSNNTFFFWPPR